MNAIQDHPQMQDSSLAYKRCITYGTFDLFHEGHRRFLERARALGSYLIVAVVTDSFNAARGKSNVRQSVVERINAVRDSGLADEIILEEYDGKINDVQKYNIDICVVGSDWAGPTEYVRYLSQYCEVVYLDRIVRDASGVEVSSTHLRGKVRIGVISNTRKANKFAQQAGRVSGAVTVGFLDETRISGQDSTEEVDSLPVFDSVDQLFRAVDAVYISVPQKKLWLYAAQALREGKHVLWEGPLGLSKSDAEGFYKLASDRNLVLFDASPTAYLPAFERMVAVAQNGKIGRICSISANYMNQEMPDIEIGPEDETSDILRELPRLPLLAIIRILGAGAITTLSSKTITDLSTSKDILKRIDISFKDAIATATVGRGVMMHEDLVVIGTKGYVHVPSPWWQMTSFELRFKEPNFEDSNEKQVFDIATKGSGYRYDLAEFVNLIKAEKQQSHRLNSRDSTIIADCIDRLTSSDKESS